MVLLASACGYHLTGKSSALPADVRQIAVPTFKNQTQQPDIAQRLTEKVVDEFVTRGGYLAASSSDTADAVLDGVVTAYRSKPVAINVEGRATRYEVQIEVQAELRDLRTDAILWRDEHYVFRQQYDVDPNQDQYFDRSILAIEGVSRDFARSVVATILEGF
jgi:outer membrane lipopolysaccharide assembly protein LptE/RlpB